MPIAVIPVAGLGTRLLPATKSQPKEMLPVGRKPVVQYIVEELSAGGIDQFLFITGPSKTAIENHFDINHELIDALRTNGKEDLLAELAYERLKVRYFFTRQRQLLGLGHAILCARSFVGKQQPFVVALGDSIIGLHAQSNIVQRMQTCFDQHACDAVIAFEEVPPDTVHQYGIAKPGSDDECFPLLDMIEKPQPSEAPSNLAVAARYILTPDIFEALDQTQPGKGGEIQLTDALRRMIREGKRVYGVRLNAHESRYDIGNFESYFKAFVDFALSDPKHGQHLREYLRQALT